MSALFFAALAALKKRAGQILAWLTADACRMALVAAVLALGAQTVRIEGLHLGVKVGPISLHVVNLTGLRQRAATADPRWRRWKRPKPRRAKPRPPQITNLRPYQPKLRGLPMPLLAIIMLPLSMLLLCMLLLLHAFLIILVRPALVLCLALLIMMTAACAPARSRSRRHSRCARNRSGFPRR
jgi:hypothetical protein